jgi:hypothetical protein
MGMQMQPPAAPPIPMTYTPGPGLPAGGSGSSSGMDPKKAMQFIAKIFGG